MFKDKDTTVIYAPAGAGKFLRNDARIYTPTGYTLMGDIKVGDVVLDGWGNPCKVQGVFPQGRRPMYKILFSDRTHLDVGAEHLNVVYRYNQDKKKKEYYVVNPVELKELVDNAGKQTIRVDIPKVKGFVSKDVPVDPYLLGSLIGNGGLTCDMRFTNSEEDVLLKVKDKLSLYDCTLVHIGKYDYRIVACGNGEKRREFRDKLKTLGSHVKSIEKHIPSQYLYNTFETRLELLRGLIDTDGYISKGGKIVFTTSSSRLSEDFAELCRSLGIRDTVSEKQGKYIKDYETHICHMSYNHYLMYLMT